uniref:Uncharacterized protein n=1 Tax=Magallana gigas TaxID=29159 RepID=A0A8W8MHA8_MAGGI
METRRTANNEKEMDKDIIAELLMKTDTTNELLRELIDAVKRSNSVGKTVTQHTRSDCCPGYIYDKDKATCVGVESTITSSPKWNILATLKNNSPKNETSMSSLVPKMTRVSGTEFYDGCPVCFTGTYCDKLCTYPQFGIGCQQSCICSKRRCNVFTGCPFTKTVIENKKSHQTNPFSTDESYQHTQKSVDNVNRNARNQTSITPIIPGLVSEHRTTTVFENTYLTEQVQNSGMNKTESMGEPLQQLGVKGTS